MDFKKIISVLIALATVATAWVAFLQNEGSNQSNIANRDANRLIVDITGAQTAGVAQINYDFDKAFLGYEELDCGLPPSCAKMK